MRVRDVLRSIVRRGCRASLLGSTISVKANGSIRPPSTRNYARWSGKGKQIPRGIGSPTAEAGQNLLAEEMLSDGRMAAIRPIAPAANIVRRHFQCKSEMSSNSVEKTRCANEGGCEPSFARWVVRPFRAGPGALRAARRRRAASCRNLRGRQIRRLRAALWLRATIRFALVQASERRNRTQ
jgi:hypothetical protein